MTFEIRNVRPPAAAIHVGDWESGPDGLARTLLWATWLDGTVTLDGRQRPDGGVEARVSVWLGDGTELDTAQARAHGSALSDAADALDALAGL